VEEWKAASAHHEHQAKRFAAELQQNRADTQRALQAEAEFRDANALLVAKAARLQIAQNKNYSNHQTTDAVGNATRIGCGYRKIAS
jgi:hypothetical protein